MLKFKSLFYCVLVSIVGCQSAPVSKEPIYSEAHLDFKSQGWTSASECCSASGKQIAIAAGGDNAAKIGVAIRKRGGNLVDSAVAVAMALAVELPQSTGLGGGGFMTLHLGGRDYFVDFRETAPHRATRDMFLDAKGEVVKDLSVHSSLAVATPGFVAGLWEIHKKWGKLPWKDLVTPAAQLARQGFPIGPRLAAALVNEREGLAKDPSLKKIFFNSKGETLAAGARLVQLDLAKSLEQIATLGRPAFYKGPIGQKLVAFLKKKGGILQQTDLDHYEVKLREPLRGEWNGFTFLSAPPPSAGGVIITETLQTLEKLNIAGMGPAQYIHTLAEVFKRAYADRSQYIGDPDFSKTGYEALLTKERAQAIRQSLSDEMATPSSGIKPYVFPKEESRQTTHMTLMDGEGNAISSTITINTSFGSGLMVPGTGIVLNNEMDDFATKVGAQNSYGLTGSGANEIAPNKRPVSSMSPTILLKEGKPVFALGAAGGSRIATAVVQVILNDEVLFKGDLKKAVFAPRVHHQWLPDRLELEEGFPDVVKKDLQRRGYELAKPPFAVRLQAVHLQSDGSLMAVHDPREEGGAAAE